MSKRWRKPTPVNRQRPCVKRRSDQAVPVSDCTCVGVKVEVRRYASESIKVLSKRYWRNRAALKAKQARASPSFGLRQQRASGGVCCVGRCFHCMTMARLTTQMYWNNKMLR